MQEVSGGVAEDIHDEDVFGDLIRWSGKEAKVVTYDRMFLVHIAVSAEAV